MTGSRRLRIAQVAPPLERVPPTAYGGTERIVDTLARELARRGHEILLFAPAGSVSPGAHVATVERALREEGAEVDPSAAFLQTIAAVLAREDDVDVIHAHLDFWNPTLARATHKPVVATFHGRLDYPDTASALSGVPGRLVAISHAHAEQPQGAPFDTVVYNGLELESAPFVDATGDGLVFVGRYTEEKGVLDAIEVARLTGRHLRIVAKQPYLASERDYYDAEIRPALGRADVEEVGELAQADRDAIVAESEALIMPSVWPEPFGLTAIEAMAVGTPVIARPSGALPEIVRHGVDGFLGGDAPAMASFVDDVRSLDRRRIRADVLERFSGRRMADGYEALYFEELQQATVGPRRQQRGPTE